MEPSAFPPAVGLEVRTEDGGEIWMWARSAGGGGQPERDREQGIGWSAGEKADRGWHGIKSDRRAVALEQDCWAGWAAERLGRGKGAALALS